MNSPLPPAPFRGEEHLYSKVDKSKKIDRYPAATMEDMYTKVNKRKSDGKRNSNPLARRSLDLDKPAPVGSLTVRGSVSPQILRNHSLYDDFQNIAESTSSDKLKETGTRPKVLSGLNKSRPKTDVNYSEFETLRDWPPSYIASPKGSSEKLDSVKAHSSKPKPRAKIEPPYAQIKGDDDSEFGYETVRNTALVRRHDSELDPGPGYEKVKTRRSKVERNDSELDPEYEKVRERLEVDPGYEKVREHQISEGDPGYECLGDGSQIPSEPGYETVPPIEDESYEFEPNYETVNFQESDVEEPGYEAVKGCDKDSYYESVKYLTNSSQGSYPPYEKLHGEHDSDSDAAGYEQLKQGNKPTVVKNEGYATGERTVINTAEGTIISQPAYAKIDKSKKRK